MTRESSLVTAQWVEDNIDNADIVIIEVDEDTTAYDKGHIKNAIKLDWTTDLQDQVRRDFVSKAQFEALLSDRGVGNDHTVVLYGGNNNWFAAYAYWYFKLYGHQDVKLMDGGRKKWELDSRELTAELPTRDKTSYTATEQDRSIRAFRDDAIAAIGVQNLIDVRSPDEYAGRLLAPAHLPQEQSQRAGHVPTSLNVPWSKNCNDDGTFKSDDDLRKLYADGRHRRLVGHHRPVPHRRALLADLVRPQGAPRARQREELRRLLDRIRLPRRRPDRPRRRARHRRRGLLMCGATEGGLSLDGVNVAKEAVIQGQVLRGTDPVGNAYVRLLDRTGEFTAEVPTSATGHFRFFAGEGEWTLRTLAPKADPVDHRVLATVGSVAEVTVTI